MPKARARRNRILSVKVGRDSSQRRLEELEPAPHIQSVRFLLSLNLLAKLISFWLMRTAPGTAVALWFLPDVLLAYHLFAPHAQGLIRSSRYFQTSRREVWLTIDDGPDPDDTPRILQLLAGHESRATFFVIGENARAHPNLIKAVCDAGHEIGHHTHTHPSGSFWCASPHRLARELDESLSVLHGIGVTPTRFRPPVGIKNLWLARALAKRAMVCVGWSARGLELRQGDARAIASRVLRNVRPGSILLLHEGPRLPAAVRVEAIRETLVQLHQAGYRCVIPPPDSLVAP